MSDLSPVPSLPTPPLPKRSRDLVYGVWAWGAALISATIVGWSVLGSVPKEMLALSAGWLAFGSYAGFMAKNNILRKP